MKKKKISIMVPYLAAIIPIVAAFLIGLTVFFNIQFKDQILELKTETGETVTHDLSNALESWIDDQIILSKAFASDQAVIDSLLDPEDPVKYTKASRMLYSVFNNNDIYSNVFLLSFHDRLEPVSISIDDEQFEIPDGGIFVSPVGKHIIGLGAANDFSTSIRAGKDYFISEVYLSLASGTPIFVISVPVEYEGKLIGAAGVAVYISHFTEKFTNQEYFSEGEYIFMADSSGDTISHPRTDLILTEKGANAVKPFIDRVENGELIFTTVFEGSTNLYIATELDAFKGYSKDRWYIYYREPLDELLKEADDISRISLILIVVLAIVLFIILFFITRVLIIKPLKVVNKELDDISQGEGDLTKEIIIKNKDEIGAIASSFNNFNTTLRNMISSIKNSASTNRGLRDKLASSTEETSAAINEILSNIQSVQSIMGNLVNQSDNAGSSTRKISNRIDGLTNQAANQSAAVEESTAAVEEMISSLKSMAVITTKHQEISDKLLKSTEDSSLMLDETYTSIQQVNTNIDSIMEMTEVIDNISSQTNLLAMNAAIEAAHAGEAGKGFAVVADEIRKLAEDSSTSSSKITNEVKTIIDQIQYSSDTSKKLQLSMTEIVTDIQSMARAFSEINSSSVEMSAGSDQVLKAMSELSDVAVKLSEAADEMKTGTGDVTTNINSVLQLTQTAKAAIEEISYGSNEILSAMLEIQDNVQELGDSTKNLSGEVNRFKTD